MMLRIFCLLTIICAMLATGKPVRAEEPVTVFAAASLRGALEAALADAGVAVRVSYGGSGTMARQVAQGAPADIVILANTAWMDWLQERGLLVAESRRDLLGNRLVLVGPENAAPLDSMDAAALIDRLAGGRLAVAHTEAVPAGIYAKEWMTASGLWDGLRPQLAETENVRAALALVSRGEAPLGIVYASDALADPGVVVLKEIEEGLHSPIVYPVALVAERVTGAARAVLAHLQSAKAADGFMRHGFVALEDGR